MYVDIGGTCQLIRDGYDEGLKQLEISQSQSEVLRQQLTGMLPDDENKPYVQNQLRVSGLREVRITNRLNLMRQHIKENCDPSFVPDPLKPEGVKWLLLGLLAGLVFLMEG